MSSVRMERLVKRFDAFAAVAGVSLEVKSGELFTLLGPSGCGKTTLLRMLAGFNRQDAGSIYFGDRQVDDLPAHLRNTGMVFQNYAVFPHLTVFENVAYGLRARKVAEADLKRRVAEALELVQLETFAQRAPGQLSGGQQQRVALARALVIRPDLLLMDEPLSNLDAKLRVEMRSEIRRLQRELGITTIYVTHDQEEALVISDRIAVMNAGLVEQVGTPREIYFQPRTKFVAGFIGANNFLSGQFSGGMLWVAGVPVVRRASAPDGPCTLAVRPEAVTLGPAEVTLAGQVAEASFSGTALSVTVALAGGGSMEVRLPNTAAPPEPGAPVQVGFPASAVAVFGPDGEVVS